MLRTILHSLRSLFARKPEPAAARVYIALVAAARNPFFYRDCAVPDTLDGRFDLILLHLFIALHRLKNEPVLSRGVMETYIADMDRSLREIGVGDMGVGKRVKRMADAFYGRMQAYEHAFETNDPAILKETLRRNVYGTAATAPTPPQVEALAQYTFKAFEDFSGQPIEIIREGGGWLVPHILPNQRQNVG